MKNTATSAAVQENPTVLIRYNPESAVPVLADNTAKMLARVQGTTITLKNMEASSELIHDAQATADEVETFLTSLRERVQQAAERFREFPGMEDFSITLTVRQWKLRQLLNDGISKLKGVRAKVLDDEKTRVQREQQKKDAEQANINREAADKAAKAAKAQGADKETVKEIRETVLATPAPMVESKALNTAQAAGVSVRYSYSAEITSLKSFLGACLNNPVLLATLAKATPDIEKAFRSMASDQKEAFSYPGITFKKTPFDVGRRS